MIEYTVRENGIRCGCFSDKGAAFDHARNKRGTAKVIKWSGDEKVWTKEVGTRSFEIDAEYGFLPGVNPAP